jgi:murein L,D-transpeptidase YcbB/YkuD
MNRYFKYLFFPLSFCYLLLTGSCGSGKSEPGHTASTPEELRQKAAVLISDWVRQASASGGNTGDSILPLQQALLMQKLYQANNYGLFWTSGQQWNPGADSLIRLLQSARNFGLYPQDYHVELIDSIRKAFAADSMGKQASKDASLWAKADLALSDACAQFLKDVKLGKLPDDSISLNKDSLLGDDFILLSLQLARDSGAINSIVRSLEPSHWGYRQIKNGIPGFLQNARFKLFTIVPAPGQKGFREALQKRLFEGGYLSIDSVIADSVQLAAAVKLFQKEKGIQVDGRAGEGTVRMLNMSDEEMFARIAISMDKFKKLPEQMPPVYIWVNAAANYLDLIEDDRVVFSSKVITGKPKTRTPLLNSAISVLITYPQWVPPPSIVSKEILPAVKKNPGYLAKKGFSLLDKDGNEVDPYSVDWSKYSRGIPYRIVQGSGDANALGIIKFHFDNQYSVYLHDTNQRYLFGNAMRSLSHGCVRVQEWQKLARYILKTDSLKTTGRSHLADSMQKWLANKEKHHIPVKNKMPVYIRYLTCEGRNGVLVFYDDIYGDDRILREKYYAGKRAGKTNE